MWHFSPTHKCHFSLYSLSSPCFLPSIFKVTDLTSTHGFIIWVLKYLHIHSGFEDSNSGFFKKSSKKGGPAGQGEPRRKVHSSLETSGGHVRWEHKEGSYTACCTPVAAMPAKKLHSPPRANQSVGWEKRTSSHPTIPCPLPVSNQLTGRNRAEMVTTKVNKQPNTCLTWLTLQTPNW